MRRFLRKIKLRHIIYSVLIILTVTLGIMTFFGFYFAPSRIDGRSMEDTVFDGDWLIIRRVGFNTHDLQRGEIIIMRGEPKEFTLLKFLNNSRFAEKVIPSPIGEDWIKRIIAIEGDVVDIQNDSIYLNGVRLIEPYLKDRNTTYERNLTEFPYTVPEGHYFVMGDNRIGSYDSRNLGAVSADEIVGVTRFRILPLSRFGIFNRGY